MIDFAKYKVITFDCYGTLIDWESGMLAALKPLLASKGIDLELVGANGGSPLQ
jgi:2-haloacid dehalogenase